MPTASAEMIHGHFDGLDLISRARSFRPRFCLTSQAVLSSPALR
jgi:hypothetical protein